jgi:hypothetical protein
VNAGNEVLRPASVFQIRFVNWLPDARTIVLSAMVPPCRKPVPNKEEGVP